MKKTIIAVWGISNQGKSDTVKRVAQQILLHYPAATTSPSPIDFTYDIDVIITIGKITIGIESQGDPKSRLFKSLPKFAAAGCDIIICSTRSYGDTVALVESLRTSHGYDIIWSTNHRSPDKRHHDLNDLSAKHIFELFDEVMAGRI